MRTYDSPTKSTALIVQAGQRFGRLVALHRVENRGKAQQWLFQCDCGASVLRVISSVRHSPSASCGCAALTQNGLAGTPEYLAWRAMRARCLNADNPYFHTYGGRGITICPRWIESFQNFYADMGPRTSPDHSLDRIDSNGNYEPSNCRWATWDEQVRNKRNRLSVALNGQEKFLLDWCAELRLKPSTVRNRLARGWSVERALSMPTDGHKNRPEEVTT